MNKPLISIVTVVYNNVHQLEATILSVLNQTYHNIEYIIIDGGSDDGSVDIIKKYADRLAYWISEPDEGIYYAMNKAVAVATGEYINFMNSGDCFYSLTVLEDIFSSTSPQSDMIYGDLCCKYSFENHIRKSEPIVDEDGHISVCHQVIFVRTKLQKYFGFDTTFKIAADMKLVQQILNHNVKIEYIPVIVVLYDIETGISSKNRIRCKYEFAKIEGITGSVIWKINFCLYAINTKTRQILKQILPKKIVNKIVKRNLLKYQ